MRAKDATVPIVGGIWPWVFPAFFNNVYHSANMFTSKGVHTTSNDPKADEMYNKAVTETDPAKAKKLWTEFMNYGYDMWVNVGIVRVPSYTVVGPKVGKFSSFAYLSQWDCLAGIQHK